MIEFITIKSYSLVKIKISSKGIRIKSRVAWECCLNLGGTPHLKLNIVKRPIAYK